ncbi:MAG: exodeoxyribonuclease V alpha subunit [bacterium]|nr:MAG: exodeoxyribonuclease V alpha subunit [bacterium]
MLIDLQGQIERITYTNEENGFTIAKVKVYGHSDLVTVVGNLLAPRPGEVIKMRGEWANHPKYGKQFKATHCKFLVPASVYGIEKYLGSGLIKGIGPIIAKRIVNEFGEQTLDIIENDIEKLAQVEGIGKKRIQMIKKAWAEQKEIREVMLFLQTHGVSSGYATKIFKHYGNRSVEILKDNLYILHQLADDGHIYYPYEKLIEKCQEILQIVQEVTITFDGMDVVYDYTDMDEIVLAYAVSVHKSQGSEYPAVVIPILTQHYVLLQRNLIYTGVTRGRKLVVMVGTRKALAIGVKNKKTQNRYTYLKRRLNLQLSGNCFVN